MIVITAAMMLMAGAVTLQPAYADEPTTVTDYAGLKSAVASGGQISLGADISVAEAVWIQKDMVLDLNGHTLNVGANKVYVLANVTFKDSSGNDSGKISGTGNSKIYAGLVSSGTTYPGKLTIESGTYVTSGNYTFRVAAESTLTMNGGTLKANQFGVYVTAASSKFTMNNGTVEATSAVGVYTVSGSDFTMNDGTVKAGQQAVTSLGNTTINGGTVTATSQIGIYVSSGTLTVSGGTIQAPHDAINIKDGVGANVIIKYGTIRATDYTGIYVGEGDVLTVKGGNITAGYAAVNDKGTVIMNGGTVVSDNAVNEMPTFNILGTVQDDGTVVKAALTMNGGKIEALGNGSAVKLQGNAVFDLNDGVIEAMYSSPERNDGGAGIAAFKDTEVTIEKGNVTAYSYALGGNGLDSGQDDGTNAKFTIKGGTLSSAGTAAVYAPQVNGKTVISGGTITGKTGIEIRAGELDITGGTITGDMHEYNFADNISGKTTIGAAVAVCQHETKQPIAVKISGGTFYANVPFSEVKPKDHTDEDVSQINYDISGGVFHSSGTDTVRVQDYFNGPFISGGKFSHYVTDYVKDGYGEKIENDPIRPEANMKAVYPWKTVSWKQNAEYGSINVERYKTTFDDGTAVASEPDGQEPVVDNGVLKVRCLYNDKIRIVPSPDKGYVVDTMTYTDKNGKTKTIPSSGEITMPASNITVTVTFKKENVADQAKTVSGILLAKMVSKGSTSLALSWNKVDGAEGYDVFLAKCGKNDSKTKSLKLVKTVKGSKTLKWTKKKLKKKTAYKAVVKAYITENGSKKYVVTSPMVHAYTSGGTNKYTNAKSITVKKGSVALKAGKTHKIKATVNLLKKGKKLMPKDHAASLRYLSSDAKIATISKSGKITAKSKGSCKIYVIAVNGARKAITVTVK
ncbi:MAG: Ig-like domain-containing protein [Eubacterium sp.]|nr:Ig-like domain-containing protein [Eubacterium sp.]